MLTPPNGPTSFGTSSGQSVAETAPHAAAPKTAKLPPELAAAAGGSGLRKPDARIREFSRIRFAPIEASGAKGWNGAAAKKPQNNLR